MNEQIKLVVERSLQARIAQCTTQIDVLRAYPQNMQRLEHEAYWRGERDAAMSALQGLHSPEFGA